MESFLPSELRKLHLSRSESWVSLQKQDIDDSNGAGHPYTTRFYQNTNTNGYHSHPSRKFHAPHPPRKGVHQITVVSPQKHVNIPVKSLSDLCRNVGDGASSSCSTEGSDFSLNTRLPGDGEDSSSDSEDEETDIEPEPNHPLQLQYDSNDEMELEDNYEEPSGLFSYKSWLFSNSFNGRILASNK